MFAALTGLFNALANAANAYATFLKFKPLFKRWEIEDEMDAIQSKIAQLRAEGGSDNCAVADTYLLRVEKLAKRAEHLPDADA